MDNELRISAVKLIISSSKGGIKLVSRSTIPLIFNAGSITVQRCRDEVFEAHMNVFRRNLSVFWSGFYGRYAKTFSVAIIDDFLVEED
ncbi:hypothetical protein NPIL_666341 [Nephila pilipes]|uniref:Uncharacterized protein n=1 Tax=Nephila pilipes TaxID=299642 RepID=A0A8X6UG72_NEPPI|nr:hypothetical protein NPIL_666341 [Nephila pilipes]